MKKIGIIIPSLSGGGAERVASYIANDLSKKYEVTVYTILNEICTYTIESNVKHIFINASSAFKPVRVIKRFCKLVKMISREDVVIAFDRNYGVTAGLIAKCKVIASERNDPYSNMGRFSFWRFYRNFLYSKANHVVFQTEYAMNYFSEGIRQHASIIENPVDDSIRLTYCPADSKVFIAACRLVAQKNIFMMLEAFSEFSESHPNYELHICGEGPLMADIKRYIAEHRLDNVFMLGYVNNVTELMSKSLIYLSSSDYEGISNTMLEAMSIGMPVICTDCPAGGARMVIQSGENGILIPVGGSQEMKAAMIRLADDKNYREMLGHNAQKVCMKFSRKAIVKKWEDVIESIIK